LLYRHFYWLPVYIAASEEYLRRMQIIFIRISILLAILPEIFIQIRYFF